MDPVAVVVLAGYLSLVVELLFFALPSEASTYQLFFVDGERDGDALVRAHRRRPLVKLAVYLLPTALGVVLFLVPPVALFQPAILGPLVPLPQLETAPVQAIGLAGVLVGRSVTFVSVLQLRRMQSEPGRGPRGLFRRSRNPGLCGMYAFYLGNACLFPCVVLFLGFVPYAWNMHRRVRLEESHLVHAAGASYRDYLARVPRYLVGGRVR